MRGLRHAPARATKSLGERNEVEAGQIDAGRTVCLHDPAERAHRAVAGIFITTNVMGSPRCAVVQIAWMQYMADPSPIRHTMRLPGRGSATPTEAGRL